MDLREATQELLFAPDIAIQLRLIDNYIQTYNRLPSKFVLPYEHVHLKPIIEAFAKDLKAFVAYIKALRDGLEGATYIEVHELYRTISLRALQQERRARLQRALALLEPQAQQLVDRELTAEDRSRLGRLVEQRWGAMRLEYMREARTEMSAKRLQAEQRDEVLAEFWSAIERGIDNGVVPLGEGAEAFIKECLK